MEIVTNQGAPDLLVLPWDLDLAEWSDDLLVKRAHGTSRHVVRFVEFGERAYALKATDIASAQREYRVLRSMHDDHLPVVEPVAVVADAPTPGRAVLVTRYLDYSLPYWYVFGRSGPLHAERLMDASVVLLVRLHLEGVFWGDCSLSNILWRRDAGAVMAYLVDAETTERHDTIGDGMRAHDLQIAMENVVGGLSELQGRGLVRDDIDPVVVAELLQARYQELWDELTRTEDFDVSERWRIEQRLRRINELGFDVQELALNRDDRTLTFRPVLVEEGHHARELRDRTGLTVQENQARRLLADIGQHRVWLEQQEGRSVPRAVATARWLAEVYQPSIDAVPPDLRSHLEPAELFHELLEHRYYLSMQRGAGVSTEEALADYIEHVLRHRLPEKLVDPSEDPDELLQGGPS
jgi:hypothetical protein